MSLIELNRAFTVFHFKLSFCISDLFQVGVRVLSNDIDDVVANV